MRGIGDRKISYDCSGVGKNKTYSQKFLVVDRLAVLRERHQGLNNNGRDSVHRLIAMTTRNKKKSKRRPGKGQKEEKSN